MVPANVIKDSRSWKACQCLGVIVDHTTRGTAAVSYILHTHKSAPAANGALNAERLLRDASLARIVSRAARLMRRILFADIIRVHFCARVKTIGSVSDICDIWEKYEPDFHLDSVQLVPTGGHLMHGGAGILRVTLVSLARVGLGGRGGRTVAV